mgnify:FL=1
MASPRPHGLHVISGVLTDNDINFIASVIHRFLTFKEASQLENLKSTYDLPDGGYFIVQDMGGIFRVIADKLEQRKFHFQDDGLVKMYIPMFFSGVVEKDTLRREGELVEIKLTQQCRQRLGKQLDREIPQLVKLERFTIMPGDKFTEFQPKIETIVKRTQYVAHNPGWYSGTMAKLHQFVGGYGRQDFDTLPDNDLERISFKLPDALQQELLEKYFDVRLPGYTGLPPAEGQFQYDYKWNKTHAIAFDSDNRPWLVQVGAKLYVMPLPIIPLTADPKFHEYIYDLGDQELINVLETFGAFPSGESFPDNGEDFQRWLRAGVIIEICDSGEFLSHQAFFTACGWSFNNRGNAAYNTGYRYDNKGIAEAATFRLSLNLEPSPIHYGTDKVTISNETELSNDDKNQLTAYLSKVMSSLGTEGSLAKTLKYKIRNIPHSIILQRANSIFGDDVSSEIDYWDKYVCNTIAQHSGKIHKLYVGKLYHHAKAINQPQIKFPEYTEGLCISFDFSPLEIGVSAECDTIMYAYYDNDVLQVVKYFYTAKKYQHQVETDYDEYMTVGSWYRNETSGDNTISGHFYLTDIDDREDIAPTETKTTIKGEDKGYDSKPFFSFDGFFQRPGTLWRNRYYTHLTKSETVRDQSVALSILVPMLNRSTILHARKKISGSKTNTESLTLGAVQDPYTYRYWTNDAVFAWSGSLEKMTGSPWPINGNPVWVEFERYNPHPSNDFADNGSWVQGFPADYTWLIHPNNNEWKQNGGGGAPPVKSYSQSMDTSTETTGDIKWVIHDKIVIASNKIPDSRYFLPSPDENGFGMSRTSSRVFLGDREYANISETNDAGFWKYTGFTSLVNHSRAYHFIGVINE